jgi:glycosyltransferase involved in cell wall biosynthesis
LREATRIVTVSEGVADDLASRHAGVRDTRWHVIPNGYDPEDLAGVIPDRGDVPPNELLISHSGTLHGLRDPETLIRAVEGLAEAGHPLARGIRIRFIGRIPERFERRMAESREAKRFTRIPYVDHRKVTALSAGSDVLLLIVDDVPQASGILTGKLFEYLGMGKPILALGPEGEAMSLVRASRAGLTVQPGDVTAMCAALVTLWDRFRNGTLAGAAAETARAFERRSLTERLAALFDELAGAG